MHTIASNFFNELCHKNLLNLFTNWKFYDKIIIITQFNIRFISTSLCLIKPQALMHISCTDVNSVTTEVIASFLCVGFGLRIFLSFGGDEA